MVITLVAVSGVVSACTPAPPVPPDAASSATLTPAAATAVPSPTFTPTPTPTATSTPTPAPSPTATPLPELVVEVSEAMLSQQVSSALVGQPLADTPFGPATVSSMSVDLTPGGILLTGEAQAGFVSLPVAAAGTVNVAEGRPVAHLGDVTAGGVLMPEPVRLSMEQALQREIDGAVTRERFRARTVIVEDEKLTVRGTRLEGP